ncbi:hypothetical protein [Mumia zhuanghuii]|uniref:hypothetical protein n=1 Tax=Mumia zhuanghuii TaxID=2585211 RepID=UPI0036367F77
MTVSTGGPESGSSELAWGSPEVDDPQPLLLEATSIGVDASWGQIYGPIDLSIRTGGLTVLAGPGGRGRVALLLTLAGRMKPTTGFLKAFGRINDAHDLFSKAVVADIDEIDGVAQAIRVHDLITEQVRWEAPWYRWVRQSRQEDLERICRPVFGDLTLPAMDAYVEELPELTAALLRIAVANTHKPPLLVVGGVDALSSVRATYKLLDRLIVLGTEQTVITADINAGYGDRRLHDVIDVPNLIDNEFVELEREALS